MSPIFERLESELEGYGAAKRWLFYFALASLLIIGIWYYLIDPLQENIDARQKEIAELRHTIKTLRPKSILVQAQNLEKQRLQIQARIEETKAGIQAIRSAVESTPVLFYNEKTYLQDLEALLRHSVELGLRIDKVQESDPPVSHDSTHKKAPPSRQSETPRLAPKKSTRITGSGAFPQWVRLSYFIESLRLPKQISKMEYHAIEGEEKEPLFSIQIEYYGVEP